MIMSVRNDTESQDIANQFEDNDEKCLPFDKFNEFFFIIPIN